MVYIFPYIFSLGYWIALFLMINIPSIIAPVFAFLVLWYLLTVIFIAGRSVFKQWNIWLNFFLFLLSSFGLVLIINSSIVRNAYVIISGLLGGLFIYVIIKYFKGEPEFVARTYLRFVSFIYMITFWQVFILLYFILISYDSSLWQVGVVAAPIVLSLGRGIIRAYSLKKSSVTLVLSVLTLTVIEFFIFLQLLPLHHFVLAALTTLWFFFIIEMVLIGQELSSRKRIFKIYGLILVGIIVVILSTAKWG